MRKKKVAITICAIAITCVLAVGGSLAYFTDQTEKVKNVFTSNDIELSGKMDESFDEETAEKFLPGDAIYKIPVLTNDKDSIDAWSAIKVDIFVDGNKVSYDKFVSDFAEIKSKNSNGEMIDGFNISPDSFELISGSYDSEDSLVFFYNDILSAGESTQPIFDEVKINTGIKTVITTKTNEKRIYKEVQKGTSNAEQIDGKWYVLVNVEKDEYDSSSSYYVKGTSGKLEKVDADFELPELEIKVQGYMIQAENVDAETAKTGLLALIGKNSDN